MSCPRRQHGAALIMVLLALALLTFTAVNISDQMRFSIDRLGNQLDNDQAWWYAIGAEDLSRAAIDSSREENTSHLSQPWARQNIIFPIDGGLITGSIRDQQSCFNLNRLHRAAENPEDPNAPSLPARQFERLATLTGLDAGIARTIRERIQDWIDTDQIPTGFNGAEDLTYTALPAPYQTPNQLMVSASEINLLTVGIDPVSGQLADLLCALPAADTLLNLNTLPADAPLLLAAMLPDDISVDDAAAALAQRPDEGWASVDTALSSFGEKASRIDDETRASLTVKSDWFASDITVQHYNARVRLLTRFTVTGNTVVSYARSHGELF